MPDLDDLLDEKPLEGHQEGNPVRSRPGIEQAIQATAPATRGGGMLGLAIAIVLGILLYRGARVLNLRSFFNVTGVLLILFAAGVLSRGIHELQEATMIPVFIEHLWDMNHIINEKGLAGLFLKSIFGYNGNPSLLEVMAYLTYLTSIVVYYFRRGPNATMAGSEQAGSSSSLNVRLQNRK